ncbi:heterokaryon incompatibility protein-domain-containing protein [Xylaria cf. heliscus]|nr:heterokaryon incompatibility protein-domain-containing protein [Xylaria cf. heliscus]
MMPGSPYIYKALPAGRTIRILHLLPAEDVEDDIELAIHVTDLDATEDDQWPYEAVTYVWGDLSRTRTVLCDEGIIFVTENCFDAMRHLRWQKKPRSLWIDAICIDQNSIDEKPGQLTLMGDIYKSAIRTIVWLGIGSPDLERAIKWMRWAGLLLHDPELVISNHVDNLTDGIYDHIRSVRAKVPWSFLSGDSHPLIVDALRALCMNEWFTRAWTAQELCLSQNVILCCGRAFMPFNLFEGCVVRMSYSGATWTFQTPPWNFFHDTWAMRGLYKFGYRMLLSTSSFRAEVEAVSPPLDQLQDLRNYFLAQWTHLVVFEMLARTRSRNASDPRDKIFALYGMFASLPAFVELVKPTYDISLAELYTVFTFQLACFSPNLAVLELVERRDLTAGLCATSAISLPSWVPNYNITTQLWIRERENSVGRQKYSNPQAQGVLMDTVNITNTGQLRLWGKTIDRIKHVGQHMTGVFGGNHAIDQNARPSAVLKEWITLTEGLVPTSFASRQAAVLALISLITNKRLPHELLQDSDEGQFLDSFNEICAQFTDYITSAPSTRDGIEEHELRVADVVHRLDIVRDSDGFFRSVHFQASDSEWSWLEPVLNALVKRLLIDIHGLALLITETEEAIGFCPGDIRPGDKIVLFLKAEKPFVVRPIREGVYIFVGTVYLMEVPQYLWPQKKSEEVVEMFDLD